MSKRDRYQSTQIETLPPWTAAPRARWNDRLLITAALLFSWANVWHTYVLDADDYMLGDQFRSGLGGALKDYFVQFGARRLLQTAYMDTLCAMPLGIINAICIAAHLAASLLFYEVTLRLLKRHGLALVFALIFAASPLAFGAMIWACGSYVAVHMALFFAALLCFFAYARKRNLGLGGSASLWAGCGLVILCLYSGDHLIPVSAFMGVLVAAVNGVPWRRMLARENRALVLAPAVVALAFVVVAVATCPFGIGSWNNEEAGSIHYDRFNARAFVSVWFYLHRMLDMFEPWRNHGALQLAFADWRPWHTAVVAVAFVSVCGLLWRASKARRQVVPPIPRTVGLVLGGMMVAVAGVHALHGGFSGSMRYQYVPFVFALWAVGWVLSLKPLPPRWQQPPVLVFAVGLSLLLLSAFTCWIDLGISRFELRRYKAAVETIARDPSVTDVQFAFQPDLYHYWPKLLRVRSHGLQEEWAINMALTSLGHRPVRVSSASSATLVTVKASADGKEIQATLEPRGKLVDQSYAPAAESEPVRMRRGASRTGAEGRD